MKWKDPEPVDVPAALRAAVGGHPLVAETLVRRGIEDASMAEAFLDPAKYHPTPAVTLPDLEKAVYRLVQAIDKKERILVWGDFDVDGQTATTLLVSGLKQLGAVVSYYIPVRERESHGIKAQRLLEVASPDCRILLTCDTGVSEHAAVALASERGLDVIVTDHHELPPELPKAYAVINPKRLQTGHPLGELPGVGTAYKLMERLYEWYGRSSEADSLLDLVALGIVADVAVLRGDTRYLLQRGLEVLRRTPRKGLLTMFELAQLTPASLTENDIGFSIAPRLNALGRLDDANPIVEFLTTSDVTQVRLLAERLEGLNAERKLLQDQVYAAARSQLENDPSLLDPRVIVLSHPSWPAGVNGLVAGRIASEFGRPAILLTTSPGQPARGSARSVDSVDITEAIRQNANLVISYGGHAGAAGLSLELDRIPDLRRGLSRAIQEMVGDVLPETVLQIDGYFSFGDLSLDLVGEIDRLAPFGHGNPPPLLATRAVRVASAAPLGRNGEHLQLLLEDTTGASHRVIRWSSTGQDPPEGYFDLAYSLSVNEFRGKRELRITWVEARKTEVPEVEIALRTIEVVDCRQAENPLAELGKILSTTSAQVWAEGVDPPSPGARNRLELASSEALVLWTAPPSAEQLCEVLERVRPRSVYVFALEGQRDDPTTFLKLLGGMVKYAMRTSAQPSAARLAARLGQTDAVIRKALAWLEAKGLSRVKEAADGSLALGEGGIPDEDRAMRIESEIRALLEETSAYRRYLHRASTGELLPR
ncbi:MAG: single-stranded-DNA-specific exonuclease RecJ [Anaerolineales bacterium]